VRSIRVRVHRVAEEGDEERKSAPAVRGVLVQADLRRQVYRDVRGLMIEGSNSSRVSVSTMFQPNVKLLEARLSAEYFRRAHRLERRRNRWRSARAPSCDIILLEFMMPDMDGVEFLPG